MLSRIRFKSYKILHVAPFEGFKLESLINRERERERERERSICQLQKPHMGKHEVLPYGVLFDNEFFSHKLFTLNKKNKTKQKIRILYFLTFIVSGHSSNATSEIKTH